MVSSLIRGLISDVKNNKNSTVKQIFILTHNTYFYKEVSYRKDHKNQSKDETFWIVRKNNNISKVLGYEYNPIKTSYEFLWDEIKEKNKATIQNTLRRILENYFNFQGKNLHDLAENFENEEEQNICKSLISWIHDGSHHILDDFHVDNSHETIDRYLFVFKDIFEKTGHIEHYKMMTGEE
jgi:wobble nucleotide-excising tRNase